MSANVYWILKREQLQALASPVRHDIVDRLTALGSLSVGALAQALGRRTTAIYRHLQVLQRVGLIVAKDANEGRRGRPASTYAAVAPHVRFARAPRQPSNRAAMIKVCRSVAAQAAKDYAAGFASERFSLEGASRNQWFFRLFTAPSRQRLRRINAALDELMALVWTPDAKPGPLLSVAWFMSPMPARRQPKAARSRRR
jgi:predicted ArsR family transcriptional regulator